MSYSLSQNVVCLTSINMTRTKRNDCLLQPLPALPRTRGHCDRCCGNAQSDRLCHQSLLTPWQAWNPFALFVVFISNALLIVKRHNLFLYVSAFLLCFLHHSWVWTAYTQLFRYTNKIPWPKNNQLTLAMREASRLAWKEFLHLILFLVWFSAKQKLSLIDKVVLKGPHLTLVSKSNLLKDLNEKCLIKAISLS